MPDTGPVDDVAREIAAGFGGLNPFRALMDYLRPPAPQADQGIPETVWDPVQGKPVPNPRYRAPQQGPMDRVLNYLNLGGR